MTREKDLKRGSEGSEGSAELLVVYDLRDPAGPVFSIGGAKTLLSWDRLVLAELVED